LRKSAVMKKETVGQPNVYLKVSFSDRRGFSQQCRTTYDGFEVAMMRKDEDLHKRRG